MRINIARQRKTFVIYLNAEGSALTVKAVEELVPSQAGRVVYFVLLESELMNLMTLNAPKLFPRLG